LPTDESVTEADL